MQVNPDNIIIVILILNVRTYFSLSNYMSMCFCIQGIN